MIDLQRFADEHRYKTRIDEDGTKIIPGKVGHVYERDDQCFGVMVMSDKGTAGKWNNARRSCLAVGMTLLQDGDMEGSLGFDPANREQVKLAIRVAKVKTRRIASPAVREQLAAARRARRTLASEPENGTSTGPLAKMTPLPHDASPEASEGGRRERVRA
jgi:hypothetical protein